MHAVDLDQIRVNPACCLKTREPEEMTAALANMVAAGQEVHTGLNGQGG